MKNNLQILIGVIIIVAISFIIARIYNNTYSPNSSNEVTTYNDTTILEPLINLSCLIVTSDQLKKSGNEIPGLAPGYANLPLELIHPIGELITDNLIRLCQSKFSNVKFSNSHKNSTESDIIIDFRDWKFIEEAGANGYNFTGIPMLVASGEGHLTIQARVMVSGNGFNDFVINEKVKGINELDIAFFPISRLSRTMTETADITAAIIADKVLKRVMEHSQIKTIIQNTIKSKP